MDLPPLLRHVGMDVVVAEPEQAVVSSPEVLHPALAGGETHHLPVEHGDAGRRLLDERPELRFAGAQGLLGTPSLGVLLDEHEGRRFDPCCALLDATLQLLVELSHFVVCREARLEIGHACLHQVHQQGQEARDHADVRHHGRRVVR